MTMLKSENSKLNLDNFVEAESGGMTIFSMFGFVVCCLVVGLAIDVTNLHRNKEWITVAADAGAHAGIVALVEEKTTDEIQAAALAAVETNAPFSLVGKTNNGVGNVQLVRFDPSTRRLVSGTPNAVQVTLHRDSTVENPVATGLLRIAGVNSFEVSAQSVAYFGAPGNCQASDGIYAKGMVTLTSGNFIGGSYCVHSQTEVRMPQQNSFEAGAGLSMPDLAACADKCYDDANPGVEAAKFEMNLELDSVASHLAEVRAAMMLDNMTSANHLKADFFAKKSLGVEDLQPLIDAKVTIDGNKKSKPEDVKLGSVVELTAVQYNDLMIQTEGKLPSGLVYNVDCRDKGNGPATWLSIGGTKDRKNVEVDTSSLETIEQVALITDCGFDVGSNARINSSLLVSTRVSSSSVINATSGAVVGDPDKSCDLSKKVYVITMSGFSVPADFTASNVAMIANGDINVAANSSSSEVEHKGTSFHAEGSVHIPANHTFNGCFEDFSGLLPGIRTIKFVMPRA
jgi:Flp pilus assembly protein TadG